MNDSIITSVEVRATLSDLMGTAVEVTVSTAGGKKGKALYAEGLSYGSHYGYNLYDGGSLYKGKGSSSAAAHINNVLADALVGMDCRQQALADQIIVESMAAAGVPAAVNISSPVSFAVLKAGAASLDMPLYEYIGGAFAHAIPVPGFMCASGSNRYGDHTGANGKPFYAFVAYDFATHDEADYALWEVENHWETALPKEYGVRIHRSSAMAIPKGRMASDAHMLDLMARVIKEAGFEGRVGLHADLSATAYYDAASGKYAGFYDCTPRSRDEMIRFLEDLPKKHPFVILQDPLAADDLEGFAELTRSTGIQIAGADLFGVDLERLRECASRQCINAAAIRMQMFPTYSDCVRAVMICGQYGLGVMPMDSAGEDNDIADYAVGFRSGSVCMSGLSSHGNKMALIERDIGPRVSFFGKYGLKGTMSALR